LVKGWPRSGSRRWPATSSSGVARAYVSANTPWVQQVSVRRTSAQDRPRHARCSKRSSLQAAPPSTRPTSIRTGKPKRRSVNCSAATYGLGVLLYSPLVGGLLTGKYRRGESGRLSTRDDGIERATQRTVVVDEVSTIAKETGSNPVRVSLAWLGWTSGRSLHQLSGWGSWSRNRPHMRVSKLCVGTTVSIEGSPWTV
jgi:hypothetical protein